MSKVVEFTGKVIRKIYGDTSDFRIFALEVSEEQITQQNLKKTKYGSVAIMGAIHELGDGLEYTVKATEEYGKNGYSYKVSNITRKRPKDSRDFHAFLKEVLTPLQAEAVWNAYPDIVQRVIDNRLDDIDFSKMYNIGEARFASIKQKIIDNYGLAELIQEFQGALSLSVLRKINEEYSSVQAVREALREDPYHCLCSLSGIAFKTADGILQELEREHIIDFGYDLKTSKQRCLACIMYFLEENEMSGNTKMSIVDLRQQVMKFTPACADKFVEALKSERIYYDKDAVIVALRRTYETELYIANNIKERLQTPPRVLNCNINSYRKVNGIDLSDEQMGLLEAVCKNNFVILTAPAGTGKSFSTKALINMFKDNRITFTLASPTGKAAKKLSAYTEERAQTIHRTLGYEGGKFLYNETNPMVTDVLLLDEVGMTDIKLFASLLRATPLTTKIILVGDVYQLNSVGCGALLRDLSGCHKIKQVNFTKVFRMGEGGVLTVCTYIRNNQKYITENKMTSIGADKSYTFIPTSKENMGKNLVALYERLLTKHEAKDITVLSAYNVGDYGCVKLNKLLQPIANPNAVSRNKHMQIKQDSEIIEFYVGDSVIQTVNNYRARMYDVATDTFMTITKCDADGYKTTETKECLIANGDQGTIVDIKDDGIIIDFDGVAVYYTYGDLPQLRHSFVVSIHKMQGSQNKIIIFCCPSSHMFMLSNNIVYTAVSRAEKTVYHFSDANTLNIAMKKSDSTKRQTMLGGLLQEKTK